MTHTVTEHQQSPILPLVARRLRLLDVSAVTGQVDSRPASPTLGWSGWVKFALGRQRIESIRAKGA